jgi:hypothetical protein
MDVEVNTEVSRSLLTLVHIMHWGCWVCPFPPVGTILDYAASETMMPRYPKAPPPSVCQLPACWPALTSGWRGWFDSPARLELLVGWDEEILILRPLLFCI